MKILFILFLTSLSLICTSQTITLKDDSQGTLKHIWVSTAMAAGTTYLISYKVKNKTSCIFIGMGTSLLIGIGGKEFIYDKYMGRGVFSVEDIKDDAWGSLTGGIIGRVVIDFESVYPKKYKQNNKNKYYRFK